MQNSSIFFSNLWARVRELIFPSLCYGCGKKLDFAACRQNRLLCSVCLSFLQPLRREGRCKKCFKEMEEGLCFHGFSYPFASFRIIFEQDTCIKNVLKQAEKQSSFFLWKALASYVVQTWVEDSWPFPSRIIFLSPSLLRKWRKGENVNFLLAKEVGNLLQVPLVFPVKTGIGVPDLSLAPLFSQERSSQDLFFFSFDQDKGPLLFVTVRSSKDRYVEDLIGREIKRVYPKVTLYAVSLVGSG